MREFLARYMRCFARIARFLICLGILGGMWIFFLLQDLVSEDYSAVNFWDGWKGFSDNPIPQTVEGYLEFLEREVEFVGRRNWRIFRIRKDKSFYLKNTESMTKNNSK